MKHEVSIRMERNTCRVFGPYPATSTDPIVAIAEAVIKDCLPQMHHESNYAVKKTTKKKSRISSSRMEQFEMVEDSLNTEHVIV